jgi:hypothetical protein
MNKLPTTRNKDVIVQHSGKEILIYDLLTNKAYALNETSAIIYQAYNGKTSLEELKSYTNFTDDIIFLALDDLRKENLIQGDSVNYFAELSRREIVRKIGFASLIALPIISSLVAPPAASAASVTCTCSAPAGSNARPEGCGCNSNADCCGVCVLNGGNPICSAPTVAAAPTAAACCPSPL